MAVKATHTFHVAPYDPESFDVERHRVVAGSYMLGQHLSVEQAQVIQGPEITLRRDNGADVLYSFEE